MKGLTKLSILNRSVTIYMLVLIVVLAVVDIRLLAQQYSMYLALKYHRGGYQNNRDGVLHYEMLTRLYPNNADNFAQLGMCYFRLGDEPRAVEAYGKAIALDPKYNFDQQK